MGVPDPQEDIPWFCSELDGSADVQIKPDEISQAGGEDELLSGTSPPWFAAAAIFAVIVLCEETQTQRAVADVAHVAEVPIRTRYQE